MSRAIFITGYPGFIAGQLAAPFSGRARDDGTPAGHSGHARRGQAAHDAIPRGRERTEIILGDITRPQLGLDEATRRRLAEEVDTVYHLAAIYDLATPHAISRLVNVTGTEMCSTFAIRCRGCRD